MDHFKEIDVNAQPSDNVSDDVVDEKAQVTTPEESSAGNVEPDNTSVETENTEVSEEEGAQSESDDTTSKTVPYSRFSEVIQERNRYKEELERLQMQQMQTQAEPSKAEPQDDEYSEVKESLRELGFISKDEVDKLVEAKLEERLAQERLLEEIESKVRKLKEEWDGKDGKPKFDEDEVAKFMAESNILDPEKAFKLLKENEFKEYWLKTAPKPPAHTDRASGSAKTVPNDDAALLEEAKATGDFTQIIKKRLFS